MFAEVVQKIKLEKPQKKKSVYITLRVEEGIKKNMQKTADNYGLTLSKYLISLHLTAAKNLNVFV